MPDLVTVINFYVKIKLPFNAPMPVCIVYSGMSHLASRNSMISEKNTFHSWIMMAVGFQLINFATSQFTITVLSMQSVKN